MHRPGAWIRQILRQQKLHMLDRCNCSCRLKEGQLGIYDTCILLSQALLALEQLANRSCRMKEGQAGIYYMCADTKAAAEAAPFTEQLVRKGYEVRNSYCSPSACIFASLLQVQAAPRHCLPCVITQAAMIDTRLCVTNADKPAHSIVNQRKFKMP